MSKGYIDAIITVDGEKIEGCGEDSFVSAYKKPLGIMGVFDGCGGIGSRIYPSLDNRSGAYIASRTAGNAVKTWFDGLEAFNAKDCNKIKDELLECIGKSLRSIVVTESNVKGDLSKNFPTTVSLVLLKEEKRGILAEYIWAGDSRGYVLEESGLVQLTRDDIVGCGDAFLNLSEDARLSNFASADGKFFLNQRVAKIDNPSILISATDGCFGYFKTPMEFEYLILDALKEVDSYNEWKVEMTKRVKKVSGDDFTMTLCVVGCGGFEKLKKVFKKRHKRLEKDYISKLNKASDKDCEKLWERYKEDYYA